MAGLDLAVQADTILGVLGPNGSGKTTAVRVLTTLLRPDRGTARVAGYDVVTQAVQVRRRIGLAGQSAALDESRTWSANLVMIGQLCRLPRRGARQIPLSVAGSAELAFPDTGPTGIYARLAERGYRVKRFAEEVESRRPDDEEAQLLRIGRSQHVLEVTRLACDPADRVLEVAVNVFPSNLWRLSYEWAASPRSFGPSAE